MSCRLLRAGNDIVCAAAERPYVPSVFERKEYCFAVRYRLCPFYCMSRTDGVFDLSGLSRERRA